MKLFVRFFIILVLVASVASVAMAQESAIVEELFDTVHSKEFIEEKVLEGIAGNGRMVEFVCFNEQDHDKFIVVFEELGLKLIKETKVQVRNVKYKPGENYMYVMIVIKK